MHNYLLPRVIPVLLLSGKGLVKGIRFRDHKYVGDPINAVHIYNAKEVDELFFLDIRATKEQRTPHLDTVRSIAEQCLMPFTIGGGIRKVADVAELLNVGAEKVCVCTAAVERPDIVSEISSVFGSQSLVVSLDVKKNFFGKYAIHTHCGTKATNLDPVAFAQQVEQLGAGELLVNSIDRDGSRKGYDHEIVKRISSAVKIPVIASGGAGENAHLRDGISAGASAVAAGSMFVFHGPRRAVLVSYPDEREMCEIRGGNA